MADTTADIARTYEAGVEPIMNNHTFGSGVVYEGAVVGLDADTNAVTATLDTAADVFAGFAMTKADYSKGARHVQVRAQGIVKLTVATTADALDVGDTVYASDNQTFTASADDGGGTPVNYLAIGRVHRIESGDGTTSVVALVHFQAASLRSL